MAIKKSGDDVDAYCQGWKNKGNRGDISLCDPLFRPASPGRARIRRRAF
jgi:hypothetical protein